MKTAKHIFWDWNGTLLNDLDISLKAINTLLKKRNLTSLSGEEYKSVFKFPVKEYYKELGFDFKNENWDTVANEYMDIYYENLYKSSIFPNSKNILTFLKNKNTQQHIVSAMEQSSLVNNVTSEGINTYFKTINGIADIYAESKIENALKLIKQLKTDPHYIYVIGDTNHDYEVATAIGAHCILIANGHQSKEVLNKTNCPHIVEDIQEIRNFFN